MFISGSRTVGPGAGLDPELPVTRSSMTTLVTCTACVQQGSVPRVVYTGRVYQGRVLPGLSTTRGSRNPGYSRLAEET